MTTNAPMNMTQVGLGINPVLSTIAQGYTNGTLVGSTLFPRVPVTARVGQILQFGKEAFRKYNLRRSPGAEVTQIDIGYKGLPYELYQNALAIKLPREKVDEAQVIAGVYLPTAALNTNMNIMLTGLEFDQAALATNPSNYLSGSVLNATSTDKWSDPACNPVKQVLAAREVVRRQIGRYPNTMLIGAAAFAALEECPALVDRFKYTTHASITAEMLAPLFKVSKIVVAEAVTEDDTDTDEMTDIWGPNAILAYVPEQIDSIETPSFGYTYTLEGMPLVENAYLDVGKRSWMYQMLYERAPVITMQASGFLFQNLV